MDIKQAIELREKYKTVGFVQSVRMDIDDLVKLILCQENEIEILKCCGNCKYWNQTYNQCESQEIKEKYGDSGYWSDRMDVCSRWEQEGERENDVD